jgi:hypothetical protein
MKETTPISGTFHSDILSPACGVDVTLTFTGTVRTLSFPNRPRGPQDLITSNIKVVATAGDKQVRWTQAGMEMNRVEPDGTVITTIAGRQPVHFTGVLKTNLETGEIILQSHHSDDIPKLCKLLTG